MGRLFEGNLRKEYPNLGQQTANKVLFMRALLQRDYGLAQDCTLTCMACIWGEEYYDEIEKIAEKYGYDGNRSGTNPLTVQRIMTVFMKAHGLKGYACSAYGKGVGWNFNTVKKWIDKSTQLILNMWKDGRGYYNNHSVTIIGYRTYEHGQFLLVYDNWNKAVSMIDYKKLYIISSINWVNA